MAEMYKGLRGRNVIVIDSATYLLTISSPDINKVAMSLYNITIQPCMLKWIYYAYIKVTLNMEIKW